MKMISVVMAVYNEPIEILKEAIDSVLGQTFKNIELIIVLDNPNEKNISRFLEEYGNAVRIIYNEKNYGLAKSLNIGIECANGEYIARMDGDDISEPDRIEKEYEFLINSKSDLVATNYSCIDESGEFIAKKSNFPRNKEILIKKLKYGNCLAHPTLLFKKEVFYKNNGYKEELLAAQDYDFILNTVKNEFNIGLLDDKLIKYRIRENSISGSKTIIQNFIRKYIQDVYFHQREYSSDYLKECLLEKTEEFCKYKADLIKYMKVSKKINKIRYIIFNKNIRRNFINNMKFNNIK